MRERRGRKEQRSIRTSGPATTIRLTPVPPFDFALSAAIFSGGDPQIRSFSDGTFRQVLRIGDDLLLATVTGSGTVDRPVVSLRLDPGPVDGRVAREAADLIVKIFNLDLDITPFAGAVRETRSCRPWPAGSAG